MAQRSESPKQASAKASAFSLTLLYIVIAGLWMTASTPIMRYLFARVGPDRLWLMEICKGWLFTAIMAPIIYSLIYRRLTVVFASQDAIRLSEQRYRQLVETAEEGVWVLDAHETTTLVNTKMAELLGYASEEMIGRPLEHFMEPDSVKLLLNDIGRSRQGIRQQRDLRLRRKDGAELWTIVSSTPIQDDQGQYAGVLATITDITARKRAEQDLLFTQFAVDRAADGIFWLSGEARFVYVNEAACRSLGYSREELLAMRVHEIDPDFSPERWIDHNAILKQRRFAVFESRHRAKDGHIFPIEVTTNLLEFDGMVYVCAFARSITERRRLEEELRQAQKMEAIGRLAGGIAHDFNNLLAVISGYSESLLRHLEPENRLRVHAEEIGKAADRGASLTRQLLAFSRRQVIKPQTLDLNRIIRDLQEMLRRTIHKSITIEQHLDPALGRIQADPGHMEQVLVNLALNARDAMAPSGGVLTIRTENVDLDNSPTPHCNLPPGPYVRLCVQDTGCGIDPELQGRIFEPFFTTKTGNGTGLGLSIVYGIVQQAGGGILVHSQPQIGTTFHILLPRIAAEVLSP